MRSVWCDTPWTACTAMMHAGNSSHGRPAGRQVPDRRRRVLHPQGHPHAAARHRLYQDLRSRRRRNRTRDDPHGVARHRSARLGDAGHRRRRTSSARCVRPQSLPLPGVPIIMLTGHGERWRVRRGGAARRARIPAQAGVERDAAGAHPVGPGQAAANRQAPLRAEPPPARSRRAGERGCAHRGPRRLSTRRPSPLIILD